MRHGDYKLATQSGNRGYFGRVALRVETDDESGAVEVSFDPVAAADWQSGARFGIDYVLEHVAKRKLFPRGARIHVESIQGHEVDTTNVVIAYAAANALVQALDLQSFPSKLPNLDAENGLFVFPK